MGEKLPYIFFFFLFLTNSAFQRVYSAESKVKNILLLNSYHQGYAWTDSITSGVVREIKANPEYNLFVKNLNCKQFGPRLFEFEKQYLKEKYSGLKFSGVIISDNDALDFVLKYQSELFPNIPVVYTGIADPEEYPLEGSHIYGIKETGDSRQVLSLIRKLLPESCCLYVITDKTTNGLLQRREFSEHVKTFENFAVKFPDYVDADSIYQTVLSGKGFDAIFYAGINQDEMGQLLNPVPVIQKISQIANVPVFTNDPQYSSPGVFGGFYRFGVQDGKMAVNLMNALLNSNRPDTIKHVNSYALRFFFDQRMLDKFKIPSQRLPIHSSVFYKKTLLSRENFTVLLIVLAVLSVAIVLLLYISQIYRGKHKRSTYELREVESQKNELEEAYEKLALTKATLEDTNMRLNDANQKLIDAKKKAEESDMLKSAFLANVSHEIRTPLNSIVGFSSLLVDEDLDEETRKSYIDLIESNTESLLVLVDEIIDLSKIEAQQLSLKKQTFSIDSLIAELYQIFILNHTKPHIQLVTNKIAPDKELVTFSDRVRVKQIFINLLSNAFKFTDEGTIEMGYVSLDDGEIALYVKDTGIGIDKNYHQVIFHRFRKLNGNLGKKIYRGTGLGLAITEKLVELLGGRIWIESTLGEGSAFYFTLDGLVLKNNPE